MLRSCVMIIYRSAQQNQADSTQRVSYCSCPGYITSPVPQTIWTFLTEVCNESKYVNKNMKQRGERADFYIIHRKTFQKAQSVQPARMPQSKSNSENAYRIGAHNRNRYLFFLGLCLRLWVQHFSSSSWRFQRSMSVACHECRSDNSSVTSSHIQACPDINTHTRGKMWFLCIGDSIFS